MHGPLIAFLLVGLLLPRGLDGHSLSLATPMGSTSKTNRPPSVSTHAPGSTLLSSILSKPFQSRLPQSGVSCDDLMPGALENFANKPLLAQTFIQAALALALQGAGCAQHAETLVLHLYRELGNADTDALLIVMARSLGTANSSGQSRSSAALQFNLEQLARTQARRCKGLTPIQGSVLHGRVNSVYRGFLAAATACHQQGNSCAGVASNGTGFFQVVDREGSYFLPHYGARSWLHQCHKVARNLRSAPEHCFSEREQRVHAVLEWIPVASTYYNLGTSLYYATQNCSDLAKERALEGAMDLGFDLLASLTGGVSSVAGLGISIGLKPAVKATIRHYNQQEELDPTLTPTNYSGLVI
ncbi:apolipoprotein F [Eublepharis macularius]|uniref:Apolipoprotein F n=1 Tax=Eublepharis macularius TaxID=481883 RepID=A0AA97J9Y9_EUBMA|nr:apolipoprotein F [Eublepharis macularius]